MGIREVQENLTPLHLCTSCQRLSRWRHLCRLRRHKFCDRVCKFCTNIIWALCTSLYLPNFLIECILLGHAHGTAALLPWFLTLCPLVCQPPFQNLDQVNSASYSSDRPRGINYLNPLIKIFPMLTQGWSLSSSQSLTGMAFWIWCARQLCCLRVNFAI